MNSNTRLIPLPATVEINKSKGQPRELMWEHVDTNKATLSKMVHNIYFHFYTSVGNFRLHFIWGLLKVRSVIEWTNAPIVANSGICGRRGSCSFLNNFIWAGWRVDGQPAATHTARLFARLLQDEHRQSRAVMEHTHILTALTTIYILVYKDGWRISTSAAILYICVCMLQKQARIHTSAQADTPIKTFLAHGHSDSVVMWYL